MRIIRLLVNWAVVLTMPIWAPLYGVYVFFEQVKDRNQETLDVFIRGKMWVWE